VEAIHDEFVAKFWALDQPVFPEEYRDVRLIESAVNRPFQSAFQKDIHPTILDKAAALFHSLVTNHPFANGNKRTAVIVMDHFMLANGLVLCLTDLEIYQLAMETAQHNEQGITSEATVEKITKKIRSGSIQLAQIKGSPQLDEIRILEQKRRLLVRKAMTKLDLVDILLEKPRSGSYS